MDSEYDAFSSSATQDLESCHICGRNFNSTALTRHVPICQKAASKKRKVFDSTKQRLEGTDIKPTANRNRPGQPPPKQAPAKNNWRAKHEDFVNTIRAARGVQKAMAEGGPLPPPPPPTINPDYVQCQYCSRRFNQTAAERHIPFCKEQQSRLPSKKNFTSQSIARENARKNYAAPKPKSRAATTTGGSSYGSRTQSGMGTTRNYNSSARGQGTMGGTGYNASRYAQDHDDLDSPSSGGSSGRMLRTGRNTETYSEARQLSAKQRSNMPPSSTRRTPASTAGSRYGASSRGGMSPSVTGTGYKHNDNGYFSADSGDSYNQAALKGTSVGHMGRAGSGSGAIAKFCHECGTKYPVQTAKFCCECGVRRATIT